MEVTGLAQYIELDGQELEALHDAYSVGLPHGYGLFVDVPIDERVLRTLEKRILDYARSGATEDRALDYDEAAASVLEDLGGTADLDDAAIQFALAQIVPSRTRVRSKRYSAHVWAQWNRSPATIRLSSG